MKIVPALLVFLIAVPVFAKSHAVNINTETDKRATPADSARISFSFHDPALEPSTYSLEIQRDGTGHYAAAYTPSVDGVSAPPPVDRIIHVQGELLNRLFTAARKSHFFAAPCKSHDHVAFTGTKTLVYSGPDGTGRCMFNYARDVAMNEAASELQAIAYTLGVGNRLAREQRYQPLSLDPELIALRRAAQDGEALEIENIAPELASIANDNAALKRDRAYARALLATAASHK